MSDDLTDGVSAAASDDDATTDAPGADAPAADGPAVPANNRHLVRVVYGVAAVVILVDQVTKYLAVKHLEGQPPIEIIGRLVQLDFRRNPGAAFSIGTD